GSSIQAVEEFQRLLNHRGSDPFSPFHAVAPIGLARAQVMAGGLAGGMQFYEEFLHGLAGGGPKFPVLRGAPKEYDRLKHRYSRQGKLPQAKTGSATKRSG